MDITGMVSVNDELITILNGLYPATTFANGKVARIATFFYASGQSTDAIDIATLPNLECLPSIAAPTVPE